MKYWACLIIASLIFVSCDDTTNYLGSTLIEGNADDLNVENETFAVGTQTIVADSVLGRSTVGYIGKVRDPETNAYLTCDFMTQFYSPEDYTLPEKSSITSLDDEGNIIADSCEIKLYYKTFYGDSLATMKVTAYEMDKPMNEGRFYYSNFDPVKEGYVSENNYKVNKVYTLTDLNVDPSIRFGTDYVKSIRVPLNKNNEERNFGTSILRHYYNNPKDFKNAYTFIHKVVPGFYFKVKGGLGSLANIYMSQLNVYFRYKKTVTKTDGTQCDSTFNSVATFPGTQEVLQTTNFENDKEVIKGLADINDCTYLKTPAGLFTEMTLPVDKIVYGHENDTINSAKVELTRLNSTQATNEYTIGAPGTLLMIPKAQMYSFFEKNKVPDFKTAFLSTFTSSSNTYTFNNIGTLIRYMYSRKGEKDWDKVVIIPVAVTYNSSEIVKVTHNLSMTSTRLIKGKADFEGDAKNAPVRINVIYSKFK